jgi:hypothetical protein
MSEQIRKEFEAKFPMPDYVYWANKAKVYVPTDWGSRTDEELCMRYNCRLDGFQAAYVSQQAEIDRLTAELAEAHQVERSFSEQLRHLDEVCAKFEAELDGVRKDAERYRWLKEEFTLSSETRTWDEFIGHDKDGNKVYRGMDESFHIFTLKDSWRFGETRSDGGLPLFDALIDAAMGGSK